MSVSLHAQPNPSDIKTFACVVANALVRAEAGGRLPPRFTRSGPQLWAAFRNELTEADLLDLAIRDLAVAMPQFFLLNQMWPEASGDELRSISPTETAEYIAQAIAQADQPKEAYLQIQAQALSIRLPSTESLNILPHPEAHYHVLELTGTGGWLAYTLTSHPDATVYYWENFTIACGTWQELLLAGLIALELGAPTRRELPVIFDPTLARVLNGDVAFDWIIGIREENQSRAEALRSFLKPQGQVVLL